MKTAIHLLGDSLVKAYGRDEDNFIGGWGDHLAYFFDQDKVEVFDYAMGGRSTRSFLNEGRFIDNGHFTTEDEPKGLGPAFNRIKKGDYVFLQFGHNDDDSKNKLTMIDRMVPLGTPDEQGIYPAVVPEEMMKISTVGFPDYYDGILDQEGLTQLEKEENRKKYEEILPTYGDRYYPYLSGATYKGFFKYYIDAIRDAGGIPVIVTSAARVFLKDGKLEAIPGHHGGHDAFGPFPYVRAARQIAAEEGVPLFDLFEKSSRLYERLGREDANYIQSIKNDLGQTIGELNYGRPAKWVKEYDGYMREKKYKDVDDTHQNRFGSFLFAAFITECLLEQEDRLKDLARHARKTPEKIVAHPEKLTGRLKDIQELYDRIELF